MNMTAAKNTTLSNAHASINHVHDHSMHSMHSMVHYLKFLYNWLQSNF